MRTISHIICICIVLVSIVVQAQNPKKVLKNSLIPEKFIITYDVNIKDTLNPEFMQNLPGQSLNEIVLGRILNSEVAPFEYTGGENKFNDTIGLNKSKIQLGGGFIDVYIDNWETGEPEMKRVSRSINMDEIVKYRFIEEWTLDERDCKFGKNIIAYCPIRKYYRDEDIEMFAPVYKIPFAILNNKQGQLKPVKSDKWTLVKKAIYEVPFVNDWSLKDSIIKGVLERFVEEDYSIIENENNPILNSVTRRNIVMLLYNQAMNQNTVAFDLDGYYRKKADIYNSLGVREKNIEIYNDLGEFVLKSIKQEFNPAEIKSMLFFEDWYINETTLQFDKRITGIAPIRYYNTDDAEGYERKTMPFVLFTNNEDKERLEKLYYKVIFNGFNSQIIDHIEMFVLLGKQSKSQDFKAFCTQKQNDLMAFLLKNGMSSEDRVNLFMLSEKNKLNFSTDILTAAPIDDLKSMFVVFNNSSDTCKNKSEMLHYCQLARIVGEKIVQLEENCQNHLSLLKIYEKMNLKDEIIKYQNTDKRSLAKCIANYYVNSKNPENKNIGISMYNKLYKDTVNCEIAAVYYDLPEDTRPKSFSIDSFIATQNEIELECFAGYLNNKHYVSIDSLERIEIMKISEKVYSKLIKRAAISDYYIGLFNAEIALSKPLNVNLLDQIIDPKDLLPILNHIFFLIASENVLSVDYLQLCKPYFEKLVTTDISEDDLWTFAFAIINWKKWSDMQKSKSFSPYVDIFMKKLLSINPNSCTYLFCNYELDLEQGKNPDINNMLNQENQDNLEVFAKFFGTGFNEYIFTVETIESGTYLEDYLINATKFYDKLLKMQPNNEEFRHDYAEVYYKLTWHYLIKNQNPKAMESASMINKIEPLNDNGIIATIFCYLLDGKTSKAYKLSDSYKLKQRASKVSYKEFFKYETQTLLEYKKDNEALKKYLEYLNN